jgi:hypothetical protein
VQNLYNLGNRDGEAVLDCRGHCAEPGKLTAALDEGGRPAASRAMRR